MLKTKTIFIIILLLLLASCSGPYTYNDNGSIIELSEDDPFQIILEGDAESDFYWQLISKNIYVELQQPVTITTEADKTTYMFNFKTLSDGKQKIEMIYTNGEAIENTFQLDIIIGSMGLITSDLKK